MDPLTTSMLVGAGAQLASGALGEILSGMDREEAERLLQQAQNEYGEIDLPVLERLVAEQVGSTEHGNVQVDPRLKQAQYRALERLKQVEDEGGLLLEDKVALNSLQNDLSQRAGQDRRAVLNNLEARGVAGSGDELAAALAGQQQASNRAGAFASNTAAQAQRRMYQSMLDRGQMAGRMRDQDFGEQSRRAEAQDAISRYNASLRTDTNRYNAGLGQVQHQNRMQMADRRAQGFRDQANMKMGKAADTRNFYGGMGLAANEAATTYGSHEQRQRDEEERRRRGY